MKKTLLFLNLLISTLFFAQSGSLDTSFAIGAGANGTIKAVAIQPNQKIIIAGDFTSFNNTPCNNIARLNSDGSLDASFSLASFTSTLVSINAILLQTDGKIVIGGNFTTTTGSGNIARLNPDGTLDTSFITGTGTDGEIKAVCLQPDGKIVIGGHFDFFNGGSKRMILRLETNGDLDTSFNLEYSFTESCPSGYVVTISIQADNKFIIGSYNLDVSSCALGRQLSAIENISRYNADGSIDYSFMNDNFGITIKYTTLVQPDQKVVSEGNNVLLRTNSTGGNDTSFNSSINGTFYSLSLQSDGKIIAGGSFANNIARLNIDGSLDTSFDVGTGANASVLANAIQTDGKIIIAGDFTTYNGGSANRIARLNVNTLSTNDYNFAERLKIYPNPATSQITINLHELKNTSLQVYDINGRVLFTQKLEAISNTINIDHLASGIYMFKVSSNEGTATSKVIKN